MVSNCANPNCNATFRFMHAGRVFRFDFPVEDAQLARQDILWDTNGMPRRTELFWLCDNCANSYTLVKNASGKIKVEPFSNHAAGQ
jgi:hypothetical protein